MKNIEQLHKITLKRGLNILPRTSVSLWADNYRQLSAGISAEPGRWHTDRAPYQRDIMDAFTQVGIHCVVVKSSSQVGKSDMMNNVIGRFAHLDPCAIMLIQPTIETAQDYSKSRISPMIRDTKVLKNLFYDLKDSAKTRDSNQTILSKIFPGGRLIICGANSPAGLASRPIRILLCDEVDRFPQSAGSEGDPVDLASKRMTTFWNRCMGLFSTPTTKGDSRIDREYLAGTQEEWQHCCPNCGEYHVLRHTEMDADYEEIKDEQNNTTFIVRSVKWRCPDCGFKFDELTMKNAPQKYVVQNPEAIHNGVRSFFVNGFSSPWLSWCDIMKEYFKARGNPEKEQVVYNTLFGESYELTGAFANEVQFLKRREDYGAELPNGVLLLTAAVDVQSNRLEYEVCDWNEESECYGILRGMIYGKTNQSGVWSELDKVLDRRYSLKNGMTLRVVRTFVDSGFLASVVYTYCKLNFNKGRFAIKGRGGPGLPLIIKSVILPKEQLPLTWLGVNEGKQQVFNRLGLSKVGEQYFHFPYDDKFLGERGYNQTYFKQLIAEHKVIRKSGGQIYSSWEPIKEHERNESLDLRVYNLAAFESCKSYIPWEELRESLTGQKAVTPEEPAQSKRNVTYTKTKTSKSVDIWG